MKNLKTPQDGRRRNFLKTVASSSIAATTLKASTLGLGLMASRIGFAAGPNGIKRCVIVYIPNGAAPDTYRFNNDGTLGPSAAALESVKENIVIFDGCKTAGRGHSDGGVGVLAGSSLTDETYDVTLEKVIGIGQQKVEIDIRNYAKGIYYLQLSVDDETVVRQLLNTR
ncbi:MAG: hypothetical protein HRU38_08830 [Saccharospirillaceae bacterium]|nr:T9SS type A sorting domain-containing protein [Pseudomonadales bacterium]NRB78758.1 hypothetical protein [Saccharospirillaceae bacterium]